MSGLPICCSMVGASCCQLAMSAVSLMWVAEVKPNPCSLSESKRRMLSCWAKVVLSQLVEVDSDLVELCCGVRVDACGPGQEGGVARGGSAP